MDVSDAAVVTIELGGVSEEEALHAVFEEALGFPGFYGRNWDAWIDCMTCLDRPDDAMTTVHVDEGATWPSSAP